VRHLVCLAGFAFLAASSACGGTPASKYPPLSFAGAAAIGSKTAAVVVMEFSDFHCPFCRRHATTVLPRLKRDYVETGKVLYVFRHFPLDSHPNAPAAGAAAACAGRQGKFWEMHDRLFAAPTRPEGAELASHANAAGLDLAQYRACVDEDGPAEVRADTALGNQLGISGTPAFVLGTNNGGTSLSPVTSISGADTYEAFAKAIDTLLAMNRQE
jgi:protein-disulfide isomerase